MLKENRGTSLIIDMQMDPSISLRTNHLTWLFVKIKQQGEMQEKVTKT